MLLIDLVFSSLIIYESIFDITLSSPDWNKIWHLISLDWWLFPLMAFVIIIAVVCFRKIRDWQIVRGYEMQTIPVFEPSKEKGGYREVKIQIMNAGHGRIQCIARLVEVVKEDGEEIPIRKISPNGNFLQWGSIREAKATLYENIPDTVKILGSLGEAYTYGDKMVFSLSGYEDIEPIKSGNYKIKVEFLRWNGVKYVRFHPFEDVLKFNYKDIEWGD